MATIYCLAVLWMQLNRRHLSFVVANSLHSSNLSITKMICRVPFTSPAPKKGSISSVTTLPSGLTVVTENASLSSTIALTYPNAGSSNEGPTEAGAALANRYLSFKSGSGLSSALIIRNLEDVGATLFASAGRRGATLGFTAAREHATFVAPLLSTISSFEKWDVKEAQSFAAAEVEEASSNAQVRNDIIFVAFEITIAFPIYIIHTAIIHRFPLLFLFTRCPLLIKSTRPHTVPNLPWVALTTPPELAARPSCPSASALTP